MDLHSAESHVNSLLRYVKDVQSSNSKMYSKSKERLKEVAATCLEVVDIISSVLQDEILCTEDEDNETSSVPEDIYHIVSMMQDEIAQLKSFVMCKQEPQQVVDPRLLLYQGYASYQAPLLDPAQVASTQATASVAVPQAAASVASVESAPPPPATEGIGSSPDDDKPLISAPNYQDQLPDGKGEHGTKLPSIPSSVRKDAMIIFANAFEEMSENTTYEYLECQQLAKILHMWYQTRFNEGKNTGFKYNIRMIHEWTSQIIMTYGYYMSIGKLDKFVSEFNDWRAKIVAPGSTSKYAVPFSVHNLCNGPIENVLTIQAAMLEDALIDRYSPLVSIPSKEIRYKFDTINRAYMKQNPEYADADIWSDIFPRSHGFHANAQFYESTEVEDDE